MLKAADMKIADSTEIPTEFSLIEIDKVVDQEFSGAEKSWTR